MSSSRRRAFKRPAVDPEAEPEPTTYDPSRFLSLDHYKRFKKIKGRTLLSERAVKLGKFTFPRVTAQIKKRKWTSLVALLMPNIDMVREFYANAYLSPNQMASFHTFVRGKQISFSTKDINTVLESTLTRPEGYAQWLQRIDYEEILKVVGTPQAEYHPLGTYKHILRQHLKEEAKVWATFIHSNIIPVSPTSDITEQ